MYLENKCVHQIIEYQWNWNTNVLYLISTNFKYQLKTWTTYLETMILRTLTDRMTKQKFQKTLYWWKSISITTFHIVTYICTICCSNHWFRYLLATNKISFCQHIFCSMLKHCLNLHQLQLVLQLEKKWMHFTEC